MVGVHRPSTGEQRPAPCRGGFERERGRVLVVAVLLGAHGRVDHAAGYLVTREIATQVDDLLASRRERSSRTGRRDRAFPERPDVSRQPQRVAHGVSTP